jgi:putative transport protein
LPCEDPELSQSLLVLFLAISFGFFVGKLKIGNVSLGVAAVMFVALFLGHLGFSMQPDLIQFVREFGLLLFVYGIGIQVGPTFFSSFKKEGLVLNALGLGTVFLGGLIAYLIHILANVKIENAVGLMSGSVTNTPGLGAAKSTLIEIQQQLNLPAAHFSDPAIAYAITYPIGVFGIILLILLSKKFLKIDLEKEMMLLQKKNNDHENTIVRQECRVTKPEVIGKTFKQVFKAYHITNVIISRQKQSGTKVVFAPSLDSIINEKDVLMVAAKQKDINNFIAIVGNISTDLFIESEEDVTTKILSVTHRTAIHKTLAQLDLFNQFDIKVTRVIRYGLEILAQPSLELFYGDTLMVVGNKEAIHEAEKIIGNSKKILLEPDFLSLFGGLIFGLIIGSIPIMIPSLPVPLKLGLAAGHSLLNFQY